MRQRALAYGNVHIPLDLFVYRTFAFSPPPPLLRLPLIPSACLEHKHPRSAAEGTRTSPSYPSASGKRIRDTHALRMCHAWLFHSRGLNPRRCSHHMPGESRDGVPLSLDALAGL